jgi:Ca2+-binding EF-hand superfamily protein|eukprot:jgi/Chrpa1/11887/Chrysochromulina_OHIO_Genome00006104-RA
MGGALVRPSSVKPKVDVDHVEIPPLSPERLGKVRTIFKEWDYDESGTLDVEEFTHVSINVGPSERKVLQHLRDMDFNGDGKIEPQEWEKYFALLTEHLDELSFQSVLDDMGKSGADLITVLRCTALAHVATAASEPTTLDEEPDDHALTPLTAERKAKVDELFGAWDVNHKGAIPLKKLQQGKITFGPQQSSLFERLQDMDADGDGNVTLTEMLMYFTVLGDHTSDDEFSLILGEMQTAAADTTLIEALMRISTTDAEERNSFRKERNSGGHASEDDDEEEKFEPLSPEKTALVRKLFDIFAKGDDKSGIPIAALQGDATIEIGPTKMTLLQFLDSMDADQNGTVTFAEMVAYFTVLGADLGDDFELILNEMVDSSSAKMHLKLAVGSS